MTNQDAIYKIKSMMLKIEKNGGSKDEFEALKLGLQALETFEFIKPHEPSDVKYIS